MIEFTIGTIHRFWAKVDRRADSECWPWLGSVDRFGRGKFWAGMHLYAPRLMLMIATGEEPPPETFACHSCDDPGCVNPAHLWWGSRSENMKDCGSKGRHGFQQKYRGSANLQSKLTEEAVRDIRSRYAGGTAPGVLAVEYGILSSSVWKVATRRSWTHVE